MSGLSFYVVLCSLSETSYFLDSFGSFLEGKFSSFFNPYSFFDDNFFTTFLGFSAVGDLSTVLGGFWIYFVFKFSRLVVKDYYEFFISVVLPSVVPPDKLPFFFRIYI